MNNRKPKTVMFYSPQGGTGKSTLSLNTAIFAAMRGFKTLLIDMSIYGSIMSSLRIPMKGGNGLSSVITHLDLEVNIKEPMRFNEALKGSIVKSSVQGNLDVLTGGNPIRVEALSQEYVRDIINSVRSLGYNMIVIDTSSELSVKNLILFEMVDYVFMPVIQDVSCGWKMMLFKEVIEKCVLEKNKFKVIINMCSRYSGFNNLEFETEIGFETIGEIPLYIKKYQNFINRGDQIHLKYNKKAYMRFQDIASTIISLKY
ncbi:MAG: CpsD/CapB family tyrosine-protein kinase [Clostridiaceae bacterium]|nr:CpsD/CapB family tyrosine-protein kinase [Clostridiaceae bacterium]